MVSKARTGSPKPAPAKAYSYVRFSTPEQAKGDSLRRQVEAARRWATERGVELDEMLTFRDLGVSAYRGRNAEIGALGDFLTAAKDGLITQGSFLIVESLDRISRQTVRRAARTMEDIVEAGVRIVDLEDGGTIYDEESLDDPTTFLILAVRLMRGNAESKIKAYRLAERYEQKRAAVAANPLHGKPFTRALPAWLTWNEQRKRVVEIPERAETLKRIFEKADSGWGQHRIAHWLTEREVDTWGEGERKAKHWHRSYISKLLRNSAVVGLFTPYTKAGGKTRKPLDPIPNYFPVVVSRAVFDRVNARLRSTAARGRNSGRTVASIVAGVAKCPLCESTVTRISKGRWVYLGCTTAHAKAGCTQPLVRYEAVAEAFIENAAAIVAEAPRGVDADEFEGLIVGADVVADELGEECQELLDELTRTKSAVVRARLAEKEAAWEEAKAELRRLRERREELATPQVRKRLAKLRETLRANPLNVPAANTAVKEALERVVIDPASSRLTLQWRHSDSTTHVMFNSGKHSRLFDEAET